MSESKATPSNSHYGFPRTKSPSHYRGYSHDTCESRDFEAIIPEDHDHRTLVLCFDGTGDQFDDDNSNIVNFFTALKKDDPAKQLVYYQAGIGTYNIPQIARPIAAKIRRIVSSMVANDLDAHVMAGYEFLMQNYQHGDKICLFGFSRGAYTASALAGMVHKVGLLPRCNYQQVPFAYKMYARRDEKGWRQSISFKKAFAIDVDIYMLGVWDTVGSVGILPKRLPFTTSNTHIKYFRHALALDERRVRFMPAFWIRPTDADLAHGVQSGAMPRSTIQKIKTNVKELAKPTDGEEDLKSESSKENLREMEKKYSQSTEYVTDVEEVWFAGCHADVGGGAVRNATRNSLARIPLRWMIRETFKLNTGIMFHRELLPGIGLDPDTLYPEIQPRTSSAFSSGQDVSDNSPTMSNFTSHHSRQETGSTIVQSRPSRKDRPKKHGGQQAYNATDFVSENEEERADAFSPFYDQLHLSKYWWILECIPQRIRYQKSDDSMGRKWAINLGKSRLVPHQDKNGIKVHRSVKLRMEAEIKEGKKYVPKAMWRVDPTWVD